MIIKNYKNSGFTLLEIIIVMALIGFLALSTMIVFGNFNKKQNLSIAYESVFTTLSEAKSYSQSQVIYDCIETEDATNGQLLGYQMTFDAASGEYMINEVCLQSDGSTTYDYIGNANDVPMLPSGIEFGSTGSVMFNVTTRPGAVDAATLSTVTIREEEDPSKNRTIRIERTGVIREL